MIGSVTPPGDYFLKHAYKVHSCMFYIERLEFSECHESCLNPILNAWSMSEGFCVEPVCMVISLAFTDINVE